MIKLANIKDEFDLFTQPKYIIINNRIKPKYKTIDNKIIF